MASIGPVSMSTGSTPTRQVSTTRARGVRPERGGLLGGHQQHGGGAVGDLRRRCRRCARRRARATGLSVASASRRGLAQALVAGDAVGGAGGLALVVEVGGVDRRRSGASKRPSAQAGRPAAGTARPKASVSARVMPHFSAMRSAPSNCEVNSYCPKYDLGIGHAEPELLRRVRARSGTRLMTSTPQATATSTTPEPTRLVARLVACCDEPHWRVDGGGGRREGQAGGQPRGAGDVERLLADLADAAADDLVDLGRVDARTARSAPSGRCRAGRRGAWWTGRRRGARWGCGRLRR